MMTVQSVCAQARPATHNLDSQPFICEQTWAVQAAWHSVSLDQWGLSPSLLCYTTIWKGGGGGGLVVVMVKFQHFI